MQNHNIQMRIKKLGAEKEFFLFFAYAISAVITIIVYTSGGTASVYPNLMYIPICLVTATNGMGKGLQCALITGFLMGPLMPLHVELNIMQSTFNWNFRTLLYLIMAFIIGYFVKDRNEEFKKNINKEKEINKAQTATIFALVKLSESRDNFSDMHIERVGLLCESLARMLGKVTKYADYISYNDYIENIYKASQLHDIGKVGIPDRILLKPGKLSPEEFDVMKSHVIIGAKTLFEVQNEYPRNKFLNLGIAIARFHHEKWDGTGYPDGLYGEDIPLSARIMTIVDVYDALRTKRPYKEAYSHTESIDIIRKDNGHFDPEIKKIFVENELEFMSIYDESVKLNNGDDYHGGPTTSVDNKNKHMLQ